MGVVVPFNSLGGDRWLLSRRNFPYFRGLLNEAAFLRERILDTSRPVAVGGDYLGCTLGPSEVGGSSLFSPMELVRDIQKRVWRIKRKPHAQDRFSNTKTHLSLGGELVDGDGLSENVCFTDGSKAVEVLLDYFAEELRILEHFDEAPKTDQLVEVACGRFADISTQLFSGLVVGFVRDNIGLSCYSNVFGSQSIAQDNDIIIPLTVGDEGMIRFGGCFWTPREFIEEVGNDVWFVDSVENDGLSKAGFVVPRIAFDKNLRFGRILVKTYQYKSDGNFRWPVCSRSLNRLIKLFGEMEMVLNGGVDSSVDYVKKVGEMRALVSKISRSHKVESESFCREVLEVINAIEERLSVF